MIEFVADEGIVVFHFLSLGKTRLIFFVFVSTNFLCRDKDQPIWVSLSRERTEMYREIIDLEYGHSAELEG